MRITVNGEHRKIDVAPDTPLLSVLRNDLGLTAAKYGCGIGVCGACTVIVAGAARRSCLIPLGEAGDAAITTLEGLAAPNGGPHPLKDAFVAEGAAQCGYCIPGIVMTAAALLDTDPHPSPAAIREALAGNLCRCGSHPRILRAVARAARFGEAGVTHAPSQKHRHSERRDGPHPLNRCAIACSESPCEAHAAGHEDPMWTGSAGGSLASLGMTGAEAADRRDRPHSTTAGDLTGATVASFITIEPDGTVTARSGKVEVGTGLRTALRRIVANEMGVPPERVRMVLGDTALTPDQGYTAGSKSIQSAGMLLERAAAAAREALVAEASRRLEVPATDVVWTGDGVAVRGDPDRVFPLGALADVPLDMPVPEALEAPAARHPDRRDAEWRDLPASPANAPRAEANPGSAQSVIPSRDVSRAELPAMLDGTFRYVHDLVLDGMLHARVIRPYRRVPGGIGAVIARLDTSAAEALPGVWVIHDGDFLAVVAEREEVAVAAAGAVHVEWTRHAPLPDQAGLFRAIRKAPVVEVRHLQGDGSTHATDRLAGPALRASYEIPYAAHASMGPSCAVADVRDGRATVWSSTQGVYQLRDAIAGLLGFLPDRVRVVSMEGSGCYGHNGADDASADAALVSRIVGRPVRLQWSRRDEFAWEPKGSAMVAEVAASLDASGRIGRWTYDVRTPTHSTRPGGHAGLLLAASQVDPPIPPVDRHRFGGGDRNAAHTYDIPHSRTTAHWIAAGPLHQSSLRSLGGFANTTAIEGFVNELAHAGGADPVAFRLRHLSDPRAREVIEAAAERASWVAGPAHRGARNATRDGQRHGQGVAYARYEGEYAYVAMVADVAVNPESGEVRVTRMTVAHDCGRIISRDGVANQVEGNVVQGVSRTLKEEVAWDADGVTSLTYETYPILTLPETPEIEVVLIDRPDEPPWGAGEGAICPVAAAIANAVFDATGIRLRRLPFTPERVHAALASG